MARCDRDQASELVKRPVGPRTSSQGGMCVVRRKGLSDEIPHVRRIRGVIIVRTEDATKVTTFLKRFGAELHARTIELTAKDAESMAVDGR